MTALGLDDLATKLGHSKLEEFLALVGRGEIGPKQLQNAVRETPAAQESAAGAATILTHPPQQTPAQQGEVLVVGVDKLLTVLARCCKPAPPDPIIGFVSRGRGVTVHRRGCRNVARLAGERLITAEWGNDAGRGRFAVDLEVESASHPDPMREILETFSREKVRVTRAASHVSDLNARIAFTLEVNGLDQLNRLLGVIKAMPGVFAARRR
jgi:GTP pyrophosphokinase